MVGKLSLGPVCLRKVIGALKKPVNRKTTAVLRVEQPELFDSGCFFDQQGAIDRAVLLEGGF